MHGRVMQWFSKRGQQQQASQQSQGAMLTSHWARWALYLPCLQLELRAWEGSRMRLKGSCCNCIAVFANGICDSNTLGNFRETAMHYTALQHCVRCFMHTLAFTCICCSACVRLHTALQAVLPALLGCLPLAAPGRVVDSSGLRLCLIALSLLLQTQLTASCSHCWPKQSLLSVLITPDNMVPSTVAAGSLALTVPSIHAISCCTSI